MNRYISKVDELVRKLIFSPTKALYSTQFARNCVFESILKENIETSSNKCLPLCQDTGVVTLFIGHQQLTANDILEIKERFQLVFNKFARPSMLSSGFLGQYSMGDSQTCFVEELRDRNGIGGIICGAGTESHSFLKVYSGTTSWKDVITELVTWTKDRGSLACPPLHVSVSVGGTSVQAVRESKLGFLFGNNFPDSYESFYEELVGSLRNIPVDPLGQGKNWVGDIFLRVLPTHISAVPVSLSFMCWPYRAEWIDIEA